MVGGGNHEGGFIEVVSIDASKVQFRLTGVVLETNEPDAPIISGDYTASRCGSGG